VVGNAVSDSNRTEDQRNWRAKARKSEPKAWESFRRALKAKPLCDNDHSMDRELWEAFLQGWKRRARAWPFNTATGWVRRAIRGI
jgi:hypothetical protein